MSLSRPERQQSSTDEKSCWVCFASEEDDRSAPWVMPCRCRGSTKWVHQMCLQRWIDEKQKGNSSAKVSCPQCNTEYIIVFPKLGPAMMLFEVVDKVINKVCPLCAGALFLGSVYWTAVTYGAVSVMQVLGHTEGLNMMEKADPLFLLIGLPTIPVLLILMKMIRWEDYILKLWRKHSRKLPLLSYLFGSSVNATRVPADTNSYSDPNSVTRVLCGALVLPTISTIVGKFVFGKVTSNFQRTLLGGITFVAIKGTLKIFYKQQQFIRQSQREIRNWGEPQTPPLNRASDTSLQPSNSGGDQPPPSNHGNSDSQVNNNGAN